jgi:Glycosyltransferase 61
MSPDAIVYGEWCRLSKSSHSIDCMQKYSCPSAIVPESKLFCHPSRLANTHEPGVEVVHQPAFSIPSEEIGISIKHATTPSQVQQGGLSWRGKLAHRYECFRAGRILDLKERFVYDARNIDNSNMAHLVHHHLAKLGYLKGRHGHDQRDVLVILQGRPASMAVRVFSLLGYEVLRTYLPVRANLVEISRVNFFHLLPWVRYLNINWPSVLGPQKVFISRKETRRLTNEREVEAALRERGYEKIYFEEIPIVEQWSIMRNANHIAAIHGAALGCLAFQSSRPDSQRAQLLELFGAGFVVNPFRKYMAVLGGRWVGCRGRITPEVARDIDLPEKARAHAFDDFELSVRAIEAALNYADGAPSLL